VPAQCVQLNFNNTEDLLVFIGASTQLFCMSDSAVNSFLGKSGVNFLLIVSIQLAVLLD